jgi:hypothetical protein
MAFFVVISVILFIYLLGTEKNQCRVYEIVFLSKKVIFLIKYIIFIICFTCFNQKKFLLF